MRFLQMNIGERGPAWRIVIIVGIVLGCHLLYEVIFFFIQRWGNKKNRVLPQLLQKHIRVPGHLLVFTISLQIALPLGKFFLNTWWYDWIHHALEILMIVAIGFLLTRFVSFLRDLGLHQYKVENPVDYSFRKAKTRFQILQRVLNLLILLGTIAFVLTTFESVRKIGGTLLASAGVVGIIIGFAAQRSLGSLFAGIQIALSQPIRIDDTVVVEGEFGTIGEINLTYVVIHTWDGRRKIVPINYFLENSFENWTRTTPEVVGKVKIYVDYNLPLEPLRKVFSLWLEQSPLWDKRAAGLLVTGCTERVMEIRATMSAKNSGDAWDLECMVREKMIDYIRENYPDALPRTRHIIQNR